jgi:hypothetical protein
MRARTGKIARLSAPIREELNLRLRNGRPANELVLWLNEMPDVKQIVAERFGGYPVSESNISEWRHGGYQDWLRDLESRLGGRAETVIVAELLDDMDQLEKIRNAAVRSARLHRICRDLARMQNLHCRGLELRLQQEKQQAPQSPKADCHDSSHLLAPTGTKKI